MKGAKSETSQEAAQVLRSKRKSPEISRPSVRFSDTNQGGGIGVGDSGKDGDDKCKRVGLPFLFELPHAGARFV